MFFKENLIISDLRCRVEILGYLDPDLTLLIAQLVHKQFPIDSFVEKFVTVLIKILLEI